MRSPYREDFVSTFYRWLAPGFYRVARRLSYGRLNVRWYLERCGDWLIWAAICRAMRQMDRRAN